MKTVPEPDVLCVYDTPCCGACAAARRRAVLRVAACGFAGRVSWGRGGLLAVLLECLDVPVHVWVGGVVDAELHGDDDVVLHAADLAAERRTRL